jgi:hypothetical protein
MKTYGRMEVMLHAYLVSVRDGGKWTASVHGRFSLWERAPDIRWTVGSVGLRAALDSAVMESRILDGPALSIITVWADVSLPT